EPFFTTKAVGKGTGLGLAQAYGIITQHNGFILADSRLGQGTTFTIYLPYYPEKQVQPLSSGAGAGQIAGQNELILLVEDNPTVLDITRAMLTHLGYRVLTAKNGAEAVELFQIHGDDIALVLTDVTMPEMGGLELAQTISARQAGVKIIAVSGYPMDASRDVDRWRQVGIVEWLQKPLNLQTLGQALRRALAGEGQAAAND
ncbi:MAG: response regulator, partial [Chloroflexi bacterium]